MVRSRARRGRPGSDSREAARHRNVVKLIDALRKSLNDAGNGGTSQPAEGRKSKKAASGQREMLMAISGKGQDEAKPAAKETKRSAR